MIDINWLPAWWALWLPWWPTTSRMHQCFNVLIYICHEFLLLFYCCVLLEIKLTTTTTINKGGHDIWIYYSVATYLNFIYSGEKFMGVHELFFQGNITIHLIISHSTDHARLSDPWLQCQISLMYSISNSRYHAMSIHFYISPKNISSPAGLIYKL